MLLVMLELVLWMMITYDTQFASLVGRVLGPSHTTKRVAQKRAALYKLRWCDTNVQTSLNIFFSANTVLGHTNGIMVDRVMGA